MNKLKELLLYHPTRTKYILLIVNIFFILFATKMFINYNNIKQAIEDAQKESEYKQIELAYSKNFQLPYEKSEYSEFFLKHENNILLPREFIVRFQEIVNKEDQEEKIETTPVSFITNPQESRNQFFYEKIFIKNK